MSSNFTLLRADQYLGILKETITQNPVEIKNVEYHEGRSYDGDWQPFPAGGYWGRNDTWYRFRAEFTVPEEFAGKYVRVVLRTGREALWNALNPQLLVRVNGTVVQALDTNHHSFPLSFSAQAGTVYKLDFETYAGREYDTQSFHDLPAQFVLTAYCHDRLSEQVYYDFYTARKAAELHPETDYRRIQIETYLTRAMNLLDCRIPGSADYFASLKEAARFMREEFYGKLCKDDSVIANCIGHTHIDVAWLWRLGQTRAKAVRSFSTELALMDEYPEHFFMSSQPQLYEYVKQDCPEVYEKIKQRVKEGRWEVEGAMWLEADCNLSSGESLIRQILHGKRFMQQEFGVDSHILWLPDVFGYSAALPQILKKTGVDTFVTSKIHWSETNHFPYDTFYWKGVDGTEIFTQYILGGVSWAKLGDSDTYSTYTGEMLPITTAKGWEIYQQKALNNELLVTVGFGDGGGGVTREMLELNRRMQHGIPGTPKSRITTAGDALARIRKNVEGKQLPKWFGELYLERHRGTYTSIGKNKNYNRRSEFLLQQREAEAVTGTLLLGSAYPKNALYADWQTVLLNQFHDIIPGSSIREVYEDSEKQYLDLLHRNTEQQTDFMQALAKNVQKPGILVYNPTGVKRGGVIELNGKKQYVRDVPAFGWTVVDESNAENPELSASETRLENRFYAITLDKTGCLTSVYDKENEREVLTGRGNLLEAFDDHPRDCDNWEICNYYTEKKWDIDDVQAITAQQDGVSASVHIRRRFLNSTIEQVITIYADARGIDFDLRADWHEHHVFLKTAFPVDILSDKATYEIQYGAVERPAHQNTSWDAAKFEVCAQKWADYAEAGYGVALLNNNKYGYAIHDGVMRLSLIKCGTYPNPVADQGLHHIRYQLLPHAGDWREAGIPNLAYAFNCPLLVEKAIGGGTLPDTFSLVHAEPENIIVTVAKEACDNDAIILRAYESQGRRTDAALTLGFAASSAQETDMLEKQTYADLPLEGNRVYTQFKPYEIKTFRVEKG